MRFLQIGLGSMGKRRIRCLKALGFQDIIGFDTREDRCTEARKLYGIRTTQDISGQDPADIDALIISSPPHRHRDGIRLALRWRKPAFVEVNLLVDGMTQAAASARRTKTLIAPSCTLRFHPAVKRIKRIVNSGKYGRATNFSYHCGQYLPDWHPWEDVQDFFVSRKGTSGCREITAFEMAWLCDIFGRCQRTTGLFGRTMDVGADIDDTYAIALKFASKTHGTILADVTSRHATRRLLLNMERGQILWDWADAAIRLYDARARGWSSLPFHRGTAAEGYHNDIIENMYVNEMAAFIAAVRGKASFPNTLEDDIHILKFLDSLERTAKHP